MAVTAGGTPYVESSDLVANYPAVSLALAEHIDDLPAAILQVVRATDGTRRTTTSTSFVDASISVTITPQKSDSNVLLIWAAFQTANAAGEYIITQITDSSNTAISGASGSQSGTTGGRSHAMQTLIAYDSPATTSATTYKGRFKSNGGTTVEIRDDTNIGQMYAIEVSA